LLLNLINNGCVPTAEDLQQILPHILQINMIRLNDSKNCTNKDMGAFYEPDSMQMSAVIGSLSIAMFVRRF